MADPGRILTRSDLKAALQQLFGGFEGGYLALGTRAEVGQATIHDMVSGKTFPRWSTLKAVLSACEVTESELAAWRRAHDRAHRDGASATHSGPGRPVGDFKDPFMLEVHRPIRLAGSDLPLLPRYVRRDHDDLLDAVVDRAAAGESMLAVLVGGSSTGKSRACWEAVQRLSGGWRIWHPYDPTRPEAALTGLGEIGPRTVVWLNETQFYLRTKDDTGERLAAGLRTLLADRKHAPVLILGTLWPEHWDTLTRRSATDHAQARDLLDGAAIPVASAFTAHDLAQLSRQSGRDERLARAAEGGNTAITQFLAGVPELLARYEHAPPAAAALIHAAMDARRLGHRRALPLALLEDAAVGYLTCEAWNGLSDDWLEQALVYAAAPAKGIPGPLTRIRRGHPRIADLPGGPHYLLADYLEQTGRANRCEIIPPDSFWVALTRHAHLSDLPSLAQAAQARGLLRHGACLAHRAWRVMPLESPETAVTLLPALRAAGAAEAFTDLALRAAAEVPLTNSRSVRSLLELSRQESEAFTILARRTATDLTLDNAYDVSGVLSTLKEESEAFTALARRAAADVPPANLRGIPSMLGILREAGETEAAALLGRRAAGDCTLDYTLNIGWVLHALGNERYEPADDPDFQDFWVYWIRPRIASGETFTFFAQRVAAEIVVTEHGTPLDWVLRFMRMNGADRAVSTLAERTAANVPLTDLPLVSKLLRELRECGEHEAYASLAGRASNAADLNDPVGAAFLLNLSREDGSDDDAFTALARRVATDVKINERAGVTGLLTVLRKEGAEEAFIILAHRVAADIPVSNAWVGYYLLKALREGRAEESFHTLAGRVATDVKFADSDWRRIPGYGSLSVKTRNPPDFDWLLTILWEGGAEGPFATLARRVAADIPLDDTGSISRVLRVLRDRGEDEAFGRLAHRAATSAPLGEGARLDGHDDLPAVLAQGEDTGLLDLLVTRLPGAGRFKLFLTLDKNGVQFQRYGREPDGTLAQPWHWSDISDQRF